MSQHPFEQSFNSFEYNLLNTSEAGTDSGLPDDHHDSTLNDASSPEGEREAARVWAVAERARCEEERYRLATELEKSRCLNVWFSLECKKRLLLTPRASF